MNEQEPREPAIEPPIYAPPEVVEIGPAETLINGGIFGKHNDSYTGHYWNGEG